MPFSGKSSRPPFDYTLQEWVQHYELRASRSQPKESTRLLQEIESAFERQYPNVAERRYKHRRFVAAMTYLDLHIQDFDVERIAVAGSEESGDVVSEHLVLALYTVYCRVPDDRVDEEFPPSLVLNFARQFAAK